MHPVRKIALLTTLALWTSVATAADSANLSEARQEAVDKGVEFLKVTQNEEGYWTTDKSPGITALCLNALVQSGVPESDETVQNAIKYLQKHIQKDGGIYHPKSNHRNYETAISMLALSNTDAKKYDDVIKDGAKFLRGLQWDEGEGIESSDTFYGGAGYGGHSRPDLSNTQYLLEALKASGAGPDDPAIKKALIFVSRTQNLETEHNTTQFASKVEDGGFYYTPAAGGTSQAGETENGGLRSYGSMTYAGLKSMIYAGLTQKDPRVKAAFSWIQKNYTLNENPGLGQQGRYYYYHTFAKTLSTLGQPKLEDADGKTHDWKADLTTMLVELQKENGSWVNTAPRWYEGDPNLATAYALMSLSFCDEE
ncbi:prenyltransferase/squalene oxidase repeat-containing protein [Thalassoroseus pseudoceratinae]|uniref:prenyltransferase/squalene oxidase repeat-containing protein n=1 Tax=Thalassoroseus pseudoceratinae TaxID=2713176 RepID=UPI00141D80BE|nr:prenyltransferase/squalene oxidase repeat-containing protein [Thalassoroseus pseudoceratinae]